MSSPVEPYRVPEPTQIGTVEILRLRVYNRDGSDMDGHKTTQVVVQPGICPLYRDGNRFYWRMTGRINERQVECERLPFGEGLFTIHDSGDRPTGRKVTFSSKAFSRHGLAELMAEPGCMEGPEQRLRFTLAEEWADA